MIRINWDIEEAVVLLDLYLKYKGKNLPAWELNNLTRMYRARAIALGFQVDDKFRNKAGLNFQLGGIKYVV